MRTFDLGRLRETFAATAGVDAERDAGRERAGGDADFDFAAAVASRSISETGTERSVPSFRVSRAEPPRRTQGCFSSIGTPPRRTTTSPAAALPARQRARAAPTIAILKAAVLSSSC